MKKVYIFAVIWFLILIIIPLVAVALSGDSEDIMPSAPQKTKEVLADTANEIDKDKLIRSTALFCKESFCDEGIKATSEVIRNNIMTGHNYNTDNLNISDEFYDRIGKICQGDSFKITFNDKKVYIPIKELTDGYTETDENYPYLSKVASPWDLNSEDYIEGKYSGAGISAYGINHLCENGESPQNALLWYLPGFKAE